MDIIRRNTDYALRAMVHLARKYGGEAVSSRVLAESEDISYQLTCKLMQKLAKANLVESLMGPKGGFNLKRAPGEITLGEVVVAIQGLVSVNKCLVEGGICDRQDICPLSGKLAGLQDTLEEYLEGVTLADFLVTNDKEQQDGCR